MSPATPNPPPVAEWLLKVCLPKGRVGKSILGDTREEFTQDLREVGPARANRRYWRSVFSLVCRFAPYAETGRSSARSSNKGYQDMISSVWFDARNAARLLLRRPALTLIAVVSLGLGIGANTAIFSLVRTILLTPLPYPDSHELVELFRIDEEVTGMNPTVSRVSSLWAVPYEVHRDWVEKAPVFIDAGGYSGTGVTLRGPDGPLGLMAGVFTSGAFGALGVPAAMGRTFLPEDDAVGATPVAVLSQGLWRTRFGEDPGIIGETLELDGTAYTVVGVMPARFSFPDHSYRLWISFSDDQKTSPVRNAGYMKVLGRLAPSITIEQARLEMAQVASRIGEAYPEEAKHGIGIFSQKDLIVSDSGTGLLISLGAVGLVLLIACTNIAGLFLVRATERRREMGVRRALGAGRHRLVGQQMSESLLLSLLGGAAGALLAIFGMEPFLSLMPDDLPRLGEMQVDWRLLATAGGFALLTGFLTGFLPALRAAGTPITAVLQEGGRSLAGGRSRTRTQAALVVSQIALAFVLLFGAGLFVRSMVRLLAVEPGFEPEGALIASVGIPPSIDTWEDAFVHFREFEARIRALAGVDEVGAASQMPFSGGWSAPPATVETAEGLWDGILHVSSVTPSYHAAMGIPVVAGRPLSPDDGADSEPVVVVSQALAEMMTPGESPLGRRIRVDVRGDSIWRTVVGVVGDVRYRLNRSPMRMAYAPVEQRPGVLDNWVIRTGSDPAALVSPVRGAAQEIHPEGSSSVQVLDEAIRQSSAVISARFSVILLGSLAALAAGLAILGVYGVLAYLVQLRSREIGIQLAMGADQSRVLRNVLFRGLAMAGVGLGIGAGLSLGLGQVLESQLFGIRSMDPAAFLAAGGLMVGATLAASFLPARKAASLDPVEVLKGE